MRRTVKKLKKFLAEIQRHERVERSRGHVTEQGGGSEGNRDQAEGNRDQAEGWRRTYLGGWRNSKTVGRENRVRKNRWRQGGK